MVNILKCVYCDKYTLKDVCDCGKKTINSLPPKAKLGDKWGKYRRIFKKNKIEGTN
jgi:H/ACA ribonucleoprotein complex subunit 3